MKKCIKCSKMKSLSDFPVRKDSPDGYRNQCKDCRSKYLKSYRKDPPKKEVIPDGMKRCFRCKELLAVDNFTKSKQNKDGLRSDCRFCKRKESAKWREKNPSYGVEYRKENSEELIASGRKYYQDNKKELAIKKKIYVKKNKKREDARKKAWYENNKERILKRKGERYRENREEIIKREYRYIRNSVQARLRHGLRGRFKKALKGKYKIGSAVRDLGCSIGELKIYLELKFQNDMTWDNYGKWHIDHIMPLASFDLTDRDQVKKACHYKNLQPLWAEDNLKKGAKLPN